MKIALDVMGSDHNPAIPVQGAVDEIRELDADFEIILVGNSEIIREALRELGSENLERIEIVHAPEVVGMEEAPATVMRKKKNSSIAVGVNLMADGKVSAFISAGNTGAVMAASLVKMGRIGGISRPGICGVLPTIKKSCVVLDVGANADCKPSYLEQFAQMGAVYMEQVFGVANPRVGLLNIGEEAVKGNELAVEAYTRLERSGLNFVGNVEPDRFHHGPADVIVTDGFTGNVAVKVTEVAPSLIGWRWSTSPILMRAAPGLSGRFTWAGRLRRVIS